MKKICNQLSTVRAVDQLHGDGCTFEEGHPGGHSWEIQGKPNPREEFLRRAQSYLSRHLDQHASAETTLELEAAALIIMVDVGRNGERQHWLDLLDILRRYTINAGGRDSGTAAAVALQRLANLHAERVATS